MSDNNSPNFQEMNSAWRRKRLEQYGLFTVLIAAFRAAISDLPEETKQKFEVFCDKLYLLQQDMANSDQVRFLVNGLSERAKDE